MKTATSIVILMAAWLASAQPTIVITNPADGTVIPNGSGEQPFWTVSQALDFGVFRVEMYIDGDLVREYEFQTMDFFNDVFVTYYYHPKSKGQHILEARVIDWSGDESWAEPVTVTK